MRPLTITVAIVISILHGLSSWSVSQSMAQERPNVVFILADDLGWSDTTLFNTTQLYETPQIERLAKRGMTFTRAYSASPLCSPTRSAILTGLSPARTGLTAPNCHLPQIILQATPGKSAPPNRKAVPVNSVTRLDPKYFTLAEALNEAGYVTGHFGKWHLGHEPYSPLENGFDIDIPHWHGPGPAGSYVGPWKYPALDIDPDQPNEHIEDRMAQEAVAFMAANKDKPFFLNYWMFSVHAPFDAKKNLIKKYAEKVDISDPQHCPTYAAMIESMDDAVGTLLDAIDNLGLAEKTIIVFASDNGGNMYNWVDHTVPTSNEPLKGGKATMYEGGVRGPCTIVWPGKTAMDSRSNEMIQSCDFYPTILDMLELKAKPNQKFDGISITPALRGGSLDRDAIFTYFPHSPGVPDWLPPAISVHQGDWKLIRLFHNGESGQHRWKLFNLAEDLSEANDLAAQHPDRVKAMDALIEEFLIDCRTVTPTVNPNFDPSKYDLTTEGKAEPKGKNPVQAAGKKPVGEPPVVAGWQARGTAQVKIVAGQLVINSSGGDPYVTYDFEKPIPPGKFSLKLKMKSNSQGDGQLFFAHATSKPKFAAVRVIDFQMTHDGQSHDYSVDLDIEKPLTALRLDPSRAKGTITLLSAELVSDSGKSLYQWEFKQ